MKSTAKVSFLLLSSKIKRTISFICLIALLSVTAGLLGNNLLHSKEMIDPVSLAIVDLEESQFSKLIFSTLIFSKDEGEGLIDIIKTDENTAKSMLDNGELTAVFVIPEGFLESVLSGENMPIKVSYNPYMPLQSHLTEMYVKQVLEILKASQAGIYTTMDFTEQNFPEKYEEMHTAINLRYMNAAMAYNHVVKPQEVAISGELDVFIHYMFSMLLFLLMLGCCLYFVILQSNFNTKVLTETLRRGQNAFATVSGWIIGWWSWYSLVGLVMIAAYACFAKLSGFVFNLMLIPAMFAILFCYSAIGVFLGLVFKNHVYSTAILSLYSVASLFFSGGIIPINYLSDSLKNIARFFPNFWGMQLIESSLIGSFALKPFLILMAISVALWILTSLYVYFSKRRRVA